MNTYSAIASGPDSHAGAVGTDGSWILSVILIDSLMGALLLNVAPQLPRRESDWDESAVPVKTINGIMIEGVHFSHCILGSTDPGAHVLS